MNFSELGLSPKVLEAVTAAGYTQPTPIQEQAIPRVLERRDVLGIAQTGTGKTAAFTLPMITLLEQGRARARMPRTLILEPTRELAAQVEESFVRYGAGQKLNVALLIGGVSFGDQDLKIARGVDVLIATPGRLLDHRRDRIRPSTQCQFAQRDRLGLHQFLGSCEHFVGAGDVVAKDALQRLRDREAHFGPRVRRQPKHEFAQLAEVAPAEMLERFGQCLRVLAAQRLAEEQRA